MGVPDASPRGSKPAWIASTAALAILGLAVTVALPVGGSTTRSTRLSQLVVDPPESCPQSRAQAELEARRALADASAGSPPTPSGEAVPEIPKPIEADPQPLVEKTEDATAPHRLSKEDLDAATEIVRHEFEKLRKADPRAALLLLEKLQQDLADDPEVVLMLAERAAIATLRNIASAQAQLQASAAIDVDRDGAGEYGTFAELSGGCTLRGSESHLEPPVLSAAFRAVQRGVVQRSGYGFAIFLPDATGQGLPEAMDGGAHLALFQASAADRCEVSWCAYAWPISSQMPGRAFFVSHQGDVLARENGTAGEMLYSGADGPSPDAAFVATSMPGAIIGDVALSSAAHDGGRWVVVQ